MVLGNVAAHAVSKNDTTPTDSEEKKQKNKNSSSLLLSQLLMLLIAVGAIYISWTCNSKVNMGTAAKVFYAFCAWFFGIFYYPYYFIFRNSTCKLI